MRLPGGGECAAGEIAWRAGVSAAWVTVGSKSLDGVVATQTRPGVQFRLSLIQ